MNNKKVSIIVPFYNVQLYIGDCLKSLLEQTYENYEIVLINDGSTDKSEEICCKFDSKKIIKVYQENQGVSIARNNGISHAKGDYIIFVDSDDIVSKNYISELVNSLENFNADMSICNYTDNINEINKVKKVIKSKVVNAKEIHDNIIKNNLKEGYLWNKIFKKDVIERNNLKFQEGIRVWEDLYFVLEYLDKIKNVVILEKNLYYYRARVGSAVNSKETANGLEDKLKILKLILLKNNCKQYEENYNGIKKLYVTILLKYLMLKANEKELDQKNLIRTKLKEVSKLKKKVKIGLKNKIKYGYLKIII